MKLQLKEIINSDLFRLGGNINKRALITNIILNPAFKFIYIHRKCNFYRNKNKLKYLFYRIKLYRLNLKYGFEISNEAQIGKGFKIDHRGSIIINPNAILGRNVNVTSGVLIGQQNRGIKEGSPVIGDNVWIGANSSIVGKVNIGNNVMIAPGTFINFDVPSNSIVFGNPGIIKESINATNGYIGWPVN